MVSSIWIAVWSARNISGLNNEDKTNIGTMYVATSSCHIMSSCYVMSCCQPNTTSKHCTLVPKLYHQRLNPNVYPTQPSVNTDHSCQKLDHPRLNPTPLNPRAQTLPPTDCWYLAGSKSMLYWCLASSKRMLLTPGQCQKNPTDAWPVPKECYWRLASAKRMLYWCLIG